MNKLRIALTGAAAIAVAFAGTAAAQEQQIVEETRIVHAGHPEGDEGKKKVEKIVKRERIGHGDAGHASMEKCDGRQFESVVESGSEQDKRKTKIKLCAAAGESDAEWKKTLTDAAVRIEANADMPAESKTKILADLRAEIARLN